ncbi:aspartate/glutamate racemase family protein [Paeniglutamicibacter sp. NPDC091659]|uniref:aspartate/glutamate racemase family protein n=1 Tax=Paeniglutamicibacter sp. NPDC091659 TaxID=3364389 RepID=UPI0037F7E2FD
MRLLIINPNISEDVTELIAAEALRSKSPDTELVVRTAGYGMQYIETRFESMLAGPAVAEVIAQNPGADAIVVAAFGDPGLPALKEFSRVPVIGITEAAFAAASLLGTRFSIIAISARITAWYRDCVESNGYASRLASIHSLTDPLRAIGSVQEDHAEILVELANRAVTEDGADVIILAGAPLAGLARQVRDRIPVPVVDGIGSGVRLAEAIAGMQTGTHRSGSCAPPPLKDRRGLSSAVDAQLSNLQQGDRQEANS